MYLAIVTTAFFPWLLGSQMCETTFRTIRSMSTFSTAINFGMLGLLRRLHRLQIQTMLQADTTSPVTFPRLLKHQRRELNSSYTKPINDIKNQDIVDAVRRAEQQATMAVNDLEMAELLKKHKKWDSATKAQVCDDDLEDDDDDNDDDIGNEEIMIEADNENLIREMYTDEEQQIGQDIEIITENKLAGNNVIEN